MFIFINFLFYFRDPLSSVYLSKIVFITHPSQIDNRRPIRNVSFSQYSHDFIHDSFISVYFSLFIQMDIVLMRPVQFRCVFLRLWCVKTWCIYSTWRKTYSTSVLYKFISLPPWSKMNVFWSMFDAVFNASQTRWRLSWNNDNGMAYVPGPISRVCWSLIFPFQIILILVLPLNDGSIYCEWNNKRKKHIKLK